ncbi:MAG: N-acetylmuramoyl-L-alanine amidase [Bacteroidales bacterium]|nr:N-acetylmuramoyl-L-alanine amidase [Bacteroidales bacterium]
MTGLSGSVMLLMFIFASLGTAGQQQPFTVVIDAGHGGIDPGAQANRLNEKDIVLDLALKLGSYIQQLTPEVKVVYTRDKDVFIPLYERAEIANRNKATLFISLHVNFFSGTSTYGAETFVLGLHKSEENLEVARKENAVILMESNYRTKYEGFDPTSPESYIMFETVQDGYLEQSIGMAQLVQNEFKNTAMRRDRGVRQAGFLVLRQITMPGILVEAGFLSNPTEARYLSSEQGQMNIAYSIFKAFKTYRDAIESKSDFRRNTAATEAPLSAAQSATPQSTRPATAANPDTVHTAAVTPYPAPSSPPHAADVSAAHEPAQAVPMSQERPVFIPQSTPESLQHAAQTPPAQSEPDAYFSVQIKASDVKLSLTSPIFKGLNDIFVMRHEGMYKYLYGKELSYSAVEKRRRSIARMFPDAFIVATYQGQRIPLHEAKKMLNP